MLAKTAEPCCKFCGCKENLELHHLFYRPNIFDTKLGDLKWACCRCHQKIHDLEKLGIINMANKSVSSSCAHQKAQVTKALGIPRKKNIEDKSIYKHEEVKPRSEMKKINFAAVLQEISEKYSFKNP